LRDLRDQVGLRATLESVEHADDDGADLVLVLGDALGLESLLEYLLDAIVLWRVHADEHRPRELDREDRLADRGDAAELGGVRLPVATHGGDVLGSRDRPEALLERELRDLRGPMQRAVRAQLLEQLMRRTVQPPLAVEHPDVVQGGG